MTFIGAHHAYRRDLHTHKKHTVTTLTKLIDNSVYVIGLVSVAANVPQLLDIWITKNTSGVSLVSWTGIFIGSIFWFIYGWLHKEKPIMLANGLLLFVQAGIVLGLLMYTTHT